MTIMLKVFAGAAEQEKLGKRYTVTQHYEDFCVIQATQAEADQLAKKYLVENISGQFILKIGDQVVDTTQPPSTGSAMGGLEPAGGFDDLFGMAQAGTADLEAHHYLVVFDGPIKQEWTQAVENAGGEIRAPYQNFTLVVLATAETIKQINQQPFVRWTGRLPAWSRIATEIRQQASSEQGPSEVSRTPTLPGTYVVVFFSPADMPQAVGAFQQFGVRIQATDENAGVMIIEARGDENEQMALLEALAAVHGVRSIRARSIKRISNNLAPRLMGAQRSLDPGQLGLSGEGEIIAVADTGLDSGDPQAIHPDFSGRVLAIKSYPVTMDYSDYILNPLADDGPADQDSGHGTHVAGSVLGSGSASRNLPGISTPIRGLAYNARLVFQAIEQEMNWSSPAFLSKYGRYLLAGIPLNLEDLLAYAYSQGARIHSNSWGGGDPGAYDTQCEQLDRFIWERKDFCVLFAAGNDGSDQDKDGIIDPMSISSPGTAKNCITIGACESKRRNFSDATYGLWWPNDYPVLPWRDDLIADNPEQVAAFSSRGPTLDGRVKPDLLAPGTFILSTRSRNLAPDNHAWADFGPSKLYFFNGGTSMATPLAAGAAALVREYLRKIIGIPNPTAALIKAALIAGATRIKSSAAKSSLSDNEQGFGKINLDAILAPTPPGKSLFLESSPGLQTGQSHLQKLLVVSNRVPLKVVLCYSDYPGHSLVNNLNLILRSPTGRIYVGSAPSGKLVLDNQNNVEVLKIPRPRPGEWQVQVIGANIPKGPQDFALVVTAAL